MPLFVKTNRPGERLAGRCSKLDFKYKPNRKHGSLLHTLIRLCAFGKSEFRAGQLWSLMDRYKL